MSSNHINRDSKDNFQHLDVWEISPLDVIGFIFKAWKMLSAAALVGAALGLAYWFVGMSYAAQSVLLNNNNNTYAFDILSWRAAQKSLPTLATQVVESGEVAGDTLNFYRVMGNELWWQKNVIPTFALTKSDANQLISIGRDLDGSTSTILNLTVNASGPTKEKAIDAVRVAGNFIRSGSAYLQIRSLINGYESNSAAQVAQINQRINAAKTDLQFLNVRSQKLEELRKRFPQGDAISYQVKDAKESARQQLPLASQIIAINGEITDNNELIDRLQIKLSQISVTNQFLSMAIPLVGKSHDGLVLAQQLLDASSAMLQKIDVSDSSARGALEAINGDIINIQNRFSNSLRSNGTPTVNKEGAIKALALGLLIGFLLAAIFTVVRMVLANLRYSQGRGEF